MPCFHCGSYATHPTWIYTCIGWLFSCDRCSDNALVPCICGLQIPFWAYLGHLSTTCRCIPAPRTPAELAAQTGSRGYGVPAPRTPPEAFLPILHAKMDTSSINNDEDACTVCQSSPSTHACVPCGHLCVCSVCAAGINDMCPICRGHLEKVIRIYVC